MADLNGFNANEVEPSIDFEPIPVDKYVSVITESEMKPTKSKTWVVRHGRLCRFVRRPSIRRVPRWRRPHVGVDGQFGRPLAGPFAQVPFRVSLQSPGDLADEINLVP